MTFQDNVVPSYTKSLLQAIFLWFFKSCTEHRESQIYGLKGLTNLRLSTFGLPAFNLLHLFPVNYARARVLPPPASDINNFTTKPTNPQAVK